VRASLTQLGHFATRPIKLLAALPLTVRSQRAERTRIVLAAMEQEREEDEFFEEPHPALWRISVVMTRREAEVTTAAANALDESQLWDAPPGYSLVGQTTAPAPLAQVSPRRLTWGARFAFVAISVAIAAALAFQLISIS
jgi:hypothetical protein